MGRKKLSDERKAANSAEAFALLDEIQAEARRLKTSGRLEALAKGRKQPANPKPDGETWREAAKREVARRHGLSVPAMMGRIERHCPVAVVRRSGFGILYRLKK